MAVFETEEKRDRHPRPPISLSLFSLAPSAHIDDTSVQPETPRKQMHACPSTPLTWKRHHLACYVSHTGLLQGTDALAKAVACALWRLVRFWYISDHF